MGATSTARPGGPTSPVRALWVATLMAVAVLAVGGQLVRLAATKQGTTLRLQAAEPIAESHARPDIVDRNGRLLATDLEGHSLYADPALVLDRDQVVERLAEVLPDLDRAGLNRQLADRSRRFVWIRRGLTPGLAQRIHNLGLPGLGFRREPIRTYPAGRLAGHVLGGVSIDNRGLSGLERHIDEAIGVEATLGAFDPARAQVRTTIDIGVQHGIEEELAAAIARYSAAGASAVILDVDSGEVLGAASFPEIDPARPVEAQAADRIDRLRAATYELGSIFKTVTMAMAFELGVVSPDAVVDVRVPLRVGRFLIRDLHPAGRPLTVREVFIRSSNVGAGRIALAVGVDRQRAFLERLGLTETMRTEAGPITPPQLPGRWDTSALVTISYGHGIAVAPLQFAAAAAALVNGGRRVAPTFIVRTGFLASGLSASDRVIAHETSAMIRELLRRNVTQSGGGGRRADVAGYEVGGKTGTAEIAANGAYQERAVIASFLAAFPMGAPRYVLLVTIHEPRPSEETRGQITAGQTAAPVAARIIARTAPLLGLASH
jgi:cell division protein FtsI (penicillin-binding protein 3)